VRRGFTLIELLVVISIITLLVSILLPSLGAARKLARQTVCASNLRNMVLGVQVYAHEHDGWLPIAEPADREFPAPGHWFMNATLLKNINVSVRKDHAGQLLGPPRDGTILICPSHQEPCQWRDGTPLEYSLSYGMNGTWGIGGRPDHLKRRRINEFRNESEVMVFVDACGVKVAPGIVLYKSCPKDNFDFRHHGRANAAFLDTHVSLIKPDDVPFGMENRYRSFWSSRKLSRGYP